MNYKNKVPENIMLFRHSDSIPSQTDKGIDYSINLYQFFISIHHHPGEVTTHIILHIIWGK